MGGAGKDVVVRAPRACYTITGVTDKEVSCMTHFLKDVKAEGSGHEAYAVAKEITCGRSTIIFGKSRAWAWNFIMRPEASNLKSTAENSLDEALDKAAHASKCEKAECGDPTVTAKYPPEVDPPRYYRPWWLLWLFCRCRVTAKQNWGMECGEEPTPTG